MSSDLDELRARLQDIAEELADRAHSSLRQALQNGDAAATAEERRLTRARRSVLKAAALLSAKGPDGIEEG